MRMKGLLGLSLLLLSACGSGGRMSDNEVVAMGARYIAAWNSQDADKVVEFWSPAGTFQTNADSVARGREAVRKAASDIFVGFPDLHLVADGTTVEGNHAVVRWTMTATNSGPDGTGKLVRISGRDEWTIGADKMIASAQRLFDAAALERQMQHGFGGG